MREREENKEKRNRYETGKTVLIELALTFLTVAKKKEKKNNKRQEIYYTFLVSYIYICIYIYYMGRILLTPI